MWDGKHLVQVYIGIMLIGIFLIELGVWKRTSLIFKSQNVGKKMKWLSTAIVYKTSCLRVTEEEKIIINLIKKKMIIIFFLFYILKKTY